MCTTVVQKYGKRPSGFASACWLYTADSILSSSHQYLHCNIWGYEFSAYWFTWQILYLCTSSHFCQYRHIFHGCVSHLAVSSYSLTGCYRSHESWIVFPLLLYSIWCQKITQYWPEKSWTYMYVRHCIFSLSSICIVGRKHWTYKIFVGYNLLNPFLRCRLASLELYVINRPVFRLISVRIFDLIVIIISSLIHGSATEYWCSTHYPDELWNMATIFVI